MGKTHVIEVCGRRFEYGVAKNGKLMLTCDRCDIREFCDENPHMEALCCNVSRNNEFLYETAQMVEDGKGDARNGRSGAEAPSGGR